MKKLTTAFGLLLCLLVFSTTSCKKSTDENNSGEGYLKLKINGTWHTWNGAQASMSQDGFNPDMQNITIAAVDGTGSKAFYLTVQDSTIKARSYNTNNTTTVFTYIEDYISMDPKIYKLGQSFFDVSQYITTFSSISNTHVKGSFMGNYLFEVSNYQKMEITEGEFLAKRIN